jgi:YVTN family beta-propeller protein
MRPACFLASLALGLCTSAAASAQNFQSAIDLNGLGDPLASAHAFGIAYEPVGDHLYVSLSGNFFAPNQAVVVVDPVTDAVIHTIDVGVFPEDIAFAYDSIGALRYGAVANSTSGSVTLWDAAWQVVATIALPDPLGFGTCYPYSLQVMGDFMYVSTQDGSGEVYAIDLNTLSLDPLAAFSIGTQSASRMAALGDELWLTTTQYDAGFAGADAGLWRQDTQSRTAAPSLLLATEHSFSLYPSASDLELHPDGRAFLTGLDFLGRLFVLDGDGQPERVIDLEGIEGYGLALSDDGHLLAVTGFVANEVLLVDVRNEKLWSRTQTSNLGTGYSQPNDAVFAHNKLYVSMQAGEAVLVFDQLPTMVDEQRYHGNLEVDLTAPNGGDTLTIDAQGFGQEIVALMVAESASPSMFRGTQFDIGPSPRLLAMGAGQVQQSYTLPPVISQVGRSIYLQAYVEDQGIGMVTRPAVVILQ